MTTRIREQNKNAKYLKLFGISDSADLLDLKKRYAVLHEKVQAQLRSNDDMTKQKGRKNIHVLNEAYSALENDIRRRAMSGHAPEIDDQTPKVSLELESMRVGFQILEGGSKFFVLEKSRVSGFGSTRTNNILSSSWPTCKLTIYDDHLEFKCLLGSHEVRFQNIVAIDKVWYVPFYLRIRQKDKNAEAVHVFGWGLGGKLRDIVKKNRLPLELDY